jgi:hypothetical protein
MCVTYSFLIEGTDLPTHPDLVSAPPPSSCPRSQNKTEEAMLRSLWKNVHRNEMTQKEPKEPKEQKKHFGGESVAVTSQVKEHFQLNQGGGGNE